MVLVNVTDPLCTDTVSFTISPDELESLRAASRFMEIRMQIARETERKNHFASLAQRLGAVLQCMPQ